MRATCGVLGLWCFALLFAHAPEGFATTQNGLDPNQGLEILSRSCSSCHDMRPIATRAMDSEGWLAIINQMVDNGAQIEIPLTVRNQGDL